MTLLCELDALLVENGIDPDAPLLCDSCGHPDEVRTPCPNNWCTIVRCAACGWELLMVGPVGCRCELGGPNPMAINGRAYRRRTRRRRP